jgi:hypothetical protein
MRLIEFGVGQNQSGLDGYRRRELRADELSSQDWVSLHMLGDLPAAKGDDADYGPDRL